MHPHLILVLMNLTGINPADVLAGDYYIPQGVNPQGFNTLVDAFAALNSFGVSSAVRFLIDDNLNEVGANLPYH